MSRSSKTLPGPWSGLLLLALSFTACSDGSDGAAGASTATLTGTVTNSANGNAPVEGATITTSPSVVGASITTDANGVFTVELPAGVYTVTCSADHFPDASDELSVLAGVPATMDFPLTPASPVVIEVTGAPSAPRPLDVLALAATATPMDGSTVQSYHWTQLGEPAASISGETTANASITLADAAAYKQNLIDNMHVLDRWAVLAVDPHTAELGCATRFEVTVTTTSGTYTQEVEVDADLDFVAWSPGLRNVPIGLPVLLGGKVQASYDWTLATPSGSQAVLQDASDRFPWFVPDVEGYYTLTVQDLASGPFTLEVRAGKWQGGIVGVDANGRPQTDCTTNCHTGPVLFEEKFVAWANSGHAEIFTDNINDGGHYGESCFACHTVGFHEGAANGGFDDSTGYGEFFAAMFPNGQSHPAPGNWSEVVGAFPEQAMLANIQCENCHGPNGYAHMNATASALRKSTSADVCAACHGEPPRHGRFQQWQQSGHGNFELAIDEGPSSSCSKCHTAQGFLDWLANGFPTSGYTGPSVDANDAQPITCVVCHDPHSVGTESGEHTDAAMRVQGDSPPLLAGFTAYEFGKGAICAVCHNTRRGDAAQALASSPDRAPHGGAQTDVLLGENLFFVNNLRGPHSLIADTCVGCHVELTPPPAELSYNLGGTNHAFVAGTSICAECHGAFEAEGLMALTDSRLAALAEQLGTALQREIGFHTDAGRSVRITGYVNGVSQTTDITPTSVFDVVAIGSSHGRQAMNVVIDGVQHDDVRCNSDAEIIHGGTQNGNLLANPFSSIEQYLSQAMWNYHMVHNDGSAGVHNPGLVTELITATSNQLAIYWP